MKYISVGRGSSRVCLWCNWFFLHSFSYKLFLSLPFSYKGNFQNMKLIACTLVLINSFFFFNDPKTILFETFWPLNSTVLCKVSTIPRFLVLFSFLFTRLERICLASSQTISTQPCNASFNTIVDNCKFITYCHGSLLLRPHTLL